MIASGSNTMPDYQNRPLGFLDAFTLAFGATIGWAWVFLSGPLIEAAGSLGSMIGFLLGGMIILSIGLTYGGFASSSRRVGGEIGFVGKALGRTAAFVCGWFLVLGYIGICAFEAVAISRAVHFLTPGIGHTVLYKVADSPVSFSSLLIGLAGCIVVATVNLRGVRLSAKLQRMGTVALLLVGVIFFVGSQILGTTSNLAPGFTNTSGVIRVVVLAPLLMFGFDVIPQAAALINKKRRVLAQIMLLSIILSMAWYILVQWSVAVCAPLETYRDSRLPSAVAMSHCFKTGNAGDILVFAGILGIATSWNAFFFAAAQLVSRMAAEGFLPSPLALQATTKRTQRTPKKAMMFVALTSSIAPFFGTNALLWIANASSFSIVIVYTFVTISYLVLVLRRKRLSAAGVGIAASLASLFLLLCFLPFGPSPLSWPVEWAIVLTWTFLGGAFGVFGGIFVSQGGGSPPLVT